MPGQCLRVALACADGGDDGQAWPVNPITSVSTSVSWMFICTSVFCMRCIQLACSASNASRWRATARTTHTSSVGRNAARKIPGSSAFAATGSPARRSCARARTSSAGHRPSKPSSRAVPKPRTQPFAQGRGWMTAYGQLDSRPDVNRPHRLLICHARALVTRKHHLQRCQYQRRLRAASRFQSVPPKFVAPRQEETSLPHVEP